MSYSYDDIYVLHAWRDNRRRLTLTQGEGYSGTLSGEYMVKAPHFQLVDERGVISIPSDTAVSMAITLPNGTEDLVACYPVDKPNGVFCCPIRTTMTSQYGEVKGEVRLTTASNTVVKFYGVVFCVKKGVSDSAAAQTPAFSALVEALSKVETVTPSGATIAPLDETIQSGGQHPVTSGVIYDYLTDNFIEYLKSCFSKLVYAHESHSSGYDADTNPVDEYSDGGVYIDNATDMGTCYVIKTGVPGNEMRYGLLFCASTSVYNYATQIALYHTGGFKYRHKHSNDTWDESWTNIELQSNKDTYNSSDTTYFGISNSEAKYPNSKSVYQFIYANAQAIVQIYKAINDNLLLGYDTLTIEKEFSIEKDLVQSYLELSTSPNDTDYAADTDYTKTVFDSADFSFGSETHGRPNKATISTVPTGSDSIVFTDTVTGRSWSEPITSPLYIQNLIPNHIYTFKILDEDGVVLRAGTAKGSGKVRMINAGGNTYNIRDIGGWAADGGNLQYGVVYRGGELNDGITITSEQQAFFKNALGICDEIDLRGSSAAVGDTSLGSGVDYLNVQIGYYPAVFNDSSKYKDIASVIKRIAKDVKNNKPVYVHCQAGADRTGMICLFIEAICGVSRADIDREYELTSFSKELKNGGWSRITRKRNTTFATSPSHYNHLKEVIAAINNMTDGNDFNDKVVRYLLRTGVTIEEINDIRFGLIDGNPDRLTNPYGAATVTKNLTNIIVDNQDTTVTLYQPYIANVFVNSSCALQSLTVTMGGTDITSTAVNNGEINIPIVTGNIVITGVAQSVQSYVKNYTLLSNSWSSGAQPITITGYNLTANTRVDVDITPTANAQLIASDCAGIYVEQNVVSDSVVLTAKYLGNVPATDVTVQLTLTEVVRGD